MKHVVGNAGVVPDGREVHLIDLDSVGEVLDRERRRDTLHRAKVREHVCLRDRQRSHAVCTAQAVITEP